MSGKEDINSIEPDNIPLQDLTPNANERSDGESSPGRQRRSFHQRTRSLFQGRGLSPDARPSSSRYGRVTTDVPEIQVNDTDIEGDGTTRRARDSGGQIAAAVPRITLDGDVTSTVFDNEGGMNVNLETMREGLMEVLESEATGSWLPGHARSRSRDPSPGRQSSIATSPLSGPRTPSAHLDDSDPWGGRRDDDTPGYDDEDGDDASYFHGYNGDVQDIDDSDTIGLTNPMHLQPISGSEIIAPTLQTPTPRGRKRSNSNVKFHTPSVSPSSRLGDDLHTAEQGLGRHPSSASTSPSSHKRKMSLVPGSPSSPVRRVSVAVQNISQRVVNLSNDPNANIVRRPSQKSLKGGHESPPEEVPSDPAHPKTPTSAEKPVFPGIQRTHVEAPWRQTANPLKGKSLRLFPPDNPIRVFLCDVLVHPFTEPFILLLILFQTVLLTAEAAKSATGSPSDRSWGSYWTDWAILGIFIIYTLEIFIRMIVSGFIINPQEPNQPEREGIRSYLEKSIRGIFTHQEVEPRPQSKIEQPPSLLRSLTLQNPEGPGHTQAQQRFRLARRAFLRHSFNRLDFVAIVSYWITFIMIMVGEEGSHHLYIFRMMSCLRILRLLGITSGTAVILRSLKKAAPLLVNVAFLIGFFWLLFAIIGVQSFKGSLRRTCVWIDPTGVQGNYTQEFQFCGGYLDANSNPMPYVLANGQPGATDSKGFLCPQSSLCVEGSNPYGGTVSFDNIFQSMELVFVIISSNTFTDLMYYTANSDYFASSLFFVFGIVILTFWLMNLLVAVITSSFQVIREEGKNSAFTAQSDETDENSPDIIKIRRVSSLKTFYDKTEFVWILVIATGLVVACFRSPSTKDPSRGFINIFQVGVTILLLIEICIRIVADWRGFHKQKRSWVDLGLAIATGIMELPIVKRHATTYAWLTIFQILRIYRLVIFVPVTRNLLSLVMGNAAGLLNLLFFVGLLTFFCSIFAVQLLRGDIPAYDNNGNIIRINFDSIFNSFLGMYQLLSSENWTLVLYAATQYQTQYNVAWISAAFFIIWFILANAIVLNMFIAVIQENFDVTEDEKRLWQIRSFLQRKDNGTSAGNLSLSSLFRFGKQKADPIEFGHAGVDMLTRDAVVDEFLDERTAPTLNHSRTIRFDTVSQDRPHEKFIASCWSMVKQIWKNREENPFHSESIFTTKRGEIAPTAMAQELSKSREKLRRAQREYLLKYPNYNVSLFIFRSKNPIRRMCQYIVGPSHGNVRFDGAPPWKPLWFAFSGFVYASIIAMVILACITTPIYQRTYFQIHGFSTSNWFIFADIGFASLFTLEAVIKVIADGFYWTPNAYLRNVWGCIDSVVLITLWISVATSFANQGEIARAVGAFKALRALRLLNVSDSARETFNSILYGARKLISAAFVSLSLLIPFAIYGLNLFAGKMVSCNDEVTPGLTELLDCVFEYPSSPFNWNVLAPRVAANPWYNFDDFASSLFILFQIVSQEGWTDVMWQAMSITGQGQQPIPRSSQINAIFFLAFNILGAVFVLTLFVSVFMRNYTEQTGVAFLTAEQRSWLEMRKILRQVRPSKRPVSSPDKRWKAWCYDRAIRKHGRWNGVLTTVLLLHLLLLVVEYYPSPAALDTSRDIIFLGFTCFYVANIVVRIVGLTWKQYIRSRWDLYGLFVVTGTAGTTAAILVIKELPIFVQFQKLFLVLDTLLLIPRNNQLDQLFKTAAASFTAIANLMITWLVLFLVYAIALTQAFGLTRIGPNGNGNLNFRTVPNALIVLFRMSCGEGWDQIMDDFSVRWPNCVESDNFFETDCGSKAYARFLFVSWNIVSMYIFVSMFVSLIFESFSYVYQQAGGLQAISREDVRKFKRAWSKFDRQGSGYLSVEAFPRFLGELTGIFAMHIYEPPHTVNAILEECRVDKANDKFGYGVDLEALNRSLETIPIWKVRRQRRRFATFFEECLVSVDKEHGGVSFTSVLITLAHYKVVSDNKSLKLEEYLRRRAKLQLVEEQMQRNIVRGFFLMLLDLRKYKQHLRSKAPSNLSHLVHGRGASVPQIFIESESTPDLSLKTSDLPPANVDFGKYSLSLTPPDGSPANSPRNSMSMEQRSPYSGNRSTLTPRSPTSPGGMSSPESPTAGRNSISVWHGRERSNTGASITGNSSSPSQRHIRVESVTPQDVMEAFQDSSWGVAMRRSVIGTRRSVDHRRRPSQAESDR